MNLALDVNTILTSLVLGGIVWMLKGQTASATAAALAVQRHEQSEREMVELRARVVAAEAAIAEVSIRVAHLEGSKQ
jgi:uncharacterized membrane protein